MGFSSGMNRLSNQDMSLFGRHWGWFFLWGVLLAALGIFAIGASVLTTIITVIILGCLLLISGVIVILDAFSFWRGKGGSFFLHFLMGILYLIAGGILIKNPLEGSLSLTLLLGMFYLILGAFRISYHMTMQMVSWGWGLFNGVITLLIGLLILANWPASSLFIIGLFVGIDLFFCGLAYIMAALGARGTR